MVFGDQGHVTAALLPGQAARNHFTGDSMGLRISLDPRQGKKIPYPCQALNPQQ
jgi:hypothetical protein